jgi:hypothetical protein
MLEVSGEKLANPILRESGASGDDVRPRLMTDQSDRQVESGALAGVAVIGRSHGWSSPRAASLGDCHLPIQCYIWDKNTI